MREIMVDAEVFERNPDITGAYEVSGGCMEPDVPDGSHVLVADRYPEPGNLVVCAEKKTVIGRVDRVVADEFLVCTNNLGKMWYSTLRNMLGVVVEVV